MGRIITVVEQLLHIKFKMSSPPEPTKNPTFDSNTCTQKKKAKNVYGWKRSHILLWPASFFLSLLKSSQWRHCCWPFGAILLNRCHSKHFSSFWNLSFLWQIFSLRVMWKETSLQKNKREKKKRWGGWEGRALLLLTEKWHASMFVTPYLIPWLWSHKRDLIIASPNQSPQCIKFALE